MCDAVARVCYLATGTVVTLLPLKFSFIGILYSAIEDELCSVQFYELANVLILVQLK